MRENLRYTIFIVFFSVVLLLISQIGVAGYIHRSVDVVWPSERIAVCWENLTQDDNIHAKKVQSIVSTEYFKAGYDFYSWVKCDSYLNLPKYLIRIEIVKGIPSCKDYGFRINHLKSGMNLKFSFSPTDVCAKNEKTKERCIQIYALHEFGHAVRLLHEHERLDSNCFRGNWEETKKSGIEVSEYDKLSIMDYCQNRRMRNGKMPIMLSKGDLEAIKKINDRQAPTSECTELQFPVKEQQIPLIIDLNNKIKKIFP